ncbi:MAG TPA: multiubiquitin domain-containing protein [Candidatus Binataceae bacterium]|nr:multiubiquitin domain-containing protein [Candidatus Binataceae bacterium]
MNDQQAQKNTDPGHGNEQKFEIQIDRNHYTVTQERMTGAQIRQVTSPPIGPDRDLFLVVPGGSDKKIADNEVVEIRNGLRFFTAPAQINPGRAGCRGALA